jgi:hypothetical protein
MLWSISSRSVRRAHQRRRNRRRRRRVERQRWEIENHLLIFFVLIPFSVIAHTPIASNLGTWHQQQHRKIYHFPLLKQPRRKLSRRPIAFPDGSRTIGISPSPSAWDPSLQEEQPDITTSHHPHRPERLHQRTRSQSHSQMNSRHKTVEIKLVRMEQERQPRARRRKRRAAAAASRRRLLRVAIHWQAQMDLCSQKLATSR